MILFAYQIPFRPRPYVAGEAVATKLVNHVDEATIYDRAPLRRDIEFEKLPVPGPGVPARAMLHHYFGRMQLDDRAWRVDTSILRVCDRQSSFIFKALRLGQVFV